MCEVYSKLKIKTPDRNRPGVFIVNVKQISQIILVFRLLTLNKLMPTGITSVMFNSS